MTDDSAEELRALGDRLGYELIRTVGSGGFGQVFLARQRSLDRLCAIKVLSAELARDAEFRARFEREGRAASRLDHPNLVTVYDQGERDGLLYIVMQYVAGENLRDVLERESPLHPQRALGLIEQGAAALDVIHRGGLIHRDIKPENFLVRRNAGRDELLLTDFGIAAFDTEASRFTSTGAGLLLTPQYAAPERWEGGQGEPATDVYALACVLFECLTGRPPYQRPTSAALCVAHLSEPPPDLRESQPMLPPELAAVLARGLAKDPRARWPSAGAMLAAARHALEAARVTAPRAPGPTPQPTNTSRLTPPQRGSGNVYRVVLPLVAVLALVAGGGVMYGLTAGSRDDISSAAAAASVAPGTTTYIDSSGASSAGSTGSGGTGGSGMSSSAPDGSAGGSTGGTAVPVVSGEDDAETWVAQLASVPVSDPDDLGTRYRAITAAIPQARVIRSDDFATTRPGYWVIYAHGPFSDGSAALDFCEQQGRAIPDDCFGRYLSHDQSNALVRCHRVTGAADDPCYRYRRSS